MSRFMPTYGPQDAQSRVRRILIDTLPTVTATAMIEAEERHRAKLDDVARVLASLVAVGQNRNMPCEDMGLFVVAAGLAMIHADREARGIVRSN